MYEFKYFNSDLFYSKKKIFEKLSTVYNFKIFKFSFILRVNVCFINKLQPNSFVYTYLFIYSTNDDYLVYVNIYNDVIRKKTKNKILLTINVTKLQKKNKKIKKLNQMLN